MDKRLSYIRKRLGEYAVGHFRGRPLPISESLDETDAIITGINILGEELEAISISRNYFNNIFNSVSDMILLVNRKNKIVDANLAACNQLNYIRDELCGLSLQDLCSNIPSARKIASTVTNTSEPFEENFLRKNGEPIAVSVKATVLEQNRNEQLLLLTITDIRYRRKAENLILRAVIETQENERKRLAKDLHDSVNSKLGLIKLHFTSNAFEPKAGDEKNLLFQSKEMLEEVIIEIRTMCFNLMPGALIRFGLMQAIKEFCQQFLGNSKLTFQITASPSFPQLAQQLQIDIYRMVQELVSNVTKHAQASNLLVSLKADGQHIKLRFQDNGIGFDESQVIPGMGLKNVKSRVKSHNGHLQIVSRPGKGTRYDIEIPYYNLSI